MAKVSVIIPVYNSEKYLRETLNSLISQTLRDIEIICVDDGSNDSSPKILREFGVKDSRIIIISQKNSGPGEARNRGLTEAKGDYIIFLDSDDNFNINMLSKMYNYAAINNLEVVVCRSIGINTLTLHKYNIHWSVEAFLLPNKKIFAGQEIEKSYFKAFCWWPWDKLYKRSYILSLNIRFPSYRNTEDLYFIAISVLMAKRISVINETLVNHRFNISTSVSRNRDQYWYCFYFALNDLKKYLISNNLYTRYEQDFINYCLSFSIWHLKTLRGLTYCFLYNSLRLYWLKQLTVTERKKEYFYDPYEFNTLQDILSTSLADHLFKRIQRLEKEIDKLKRQRDILISRKIILFYSLLKKSPKLLSYLKNYGLKKTIIKIYYFVLYG